MNTDASFPDLVHLLTSLDQELAEALQKEQSTHSQRASAEALEEIGRHICFTLAGKPLAIPLSLVAEVGELETVRPLPFLPEWVEGVTNIRGEIVSVTNLAVFFHLQVTGQRKGQTVVIIHDEGVKTAIIVDKITGTRLLYSKQGLVTTEASIQRLPPQFLQGTALYVTENVEVHIDRFDAKRLLTALRL
jgi:purine-binding chemotaxis protein CheW